MIHWAQVKVHGAFMRTILNPSNKQCYCDEKAHDQNFDLEYRVIKNTSFEMPVLYFLCPKIKAEKRNKGWCELYVSASLF